MKRINIKIGSIIASISVIIVSILLSACDANVMGVEQGTTERTTTSYEDVISDTTPVHKTITAQEAKVMMDELDDFVIVDVRSQEEFNTGYIEGAILIPHTQMSEMAPEILTDQNQVILIYCRSGRRSAYAAEVLTSMGYTQVYDFGGIIDWPYETVQPEP